MAISNRYQIETTTDRYLLEDGSGVYLIEGIDLLDIVITMGPITQTPV